MSLGELVRKRRLEKGLTLATVAARCKLRKQYLSDLEHGKRGARMDGLVASRLAACLDLPMQEITDRLDKLTDKEQRNYAAYHRVLRSNLRAGAALGYIRDLRDHIGLLRVSLKSGKDGFKLLQQLETTVNLLDDTLSYKREPAQRYAETEGDDAKFTPVRPAGSVR